MNKILKWILGIFSFLVVAVIIGVVIFVSKFDLNEYKPQIEKIVYEQTGRKLSLNGDIKLKISFIPTIAVKDVTFENASWAKNEHMVSIKEADVSLAILPLLHKEIEIGEINIIEPVISLAVNKEGKANFEFEKPTLEDSQKTDETLEEEVEEISAAAAPLLAGFFAEKVYIENGVVSYEDMKSNSKTKVSIKKFELASEDKDDNIDLVYDIIFNGQDIIGTATGDSINTLLKNEPYNMSLNTKAYGLTLKGKALLRDLMGDLSFNADVDVLSPNGNFDLPKTELLAKVDGNLSIINAAIQKLDFGGNIIEGNIKTDLSGKKPNITGNIKSALINLTTLKNKKTAELSLISTANAAAYVPNDTLDLTALNTFNANISFDVKKLIVNEDISLSDIKGKVTVQNGTLNLAPLSAVAGTGALSGTFDIQSTSNALNMNIEGKDIIAQDFMKNLNPQGNNFGFLSGGKTNLNLKLKSSGATYQKLVENLDGQLLFVIGESKLQAGSLKYLRGNFISQLLSTLNIQAKDPKMSLKCAVLRADFKDGKANFPKGIVFDTKKMTVVGDGTVNLKNDKLDISIKPFNGNLTDVNIAQAISSLVKISGTVQNPSIALDSSSVVKNVVGVAITGPAFIGSQLLLDTDPAPCYTALKGTTYGTMFEAPTGVKAGAQNAYSGASDAVGSGVGLVTDTADAIVGGSVDVLTGTAKGVLNLLGGKKNKEKKSE